VTPSTPQTIEGVTVSEVKGSGTCRLTFPDGLTLHRTPHHVRAMGLVVPEPVVACRIGTAEFTLTREQVEAVACWALLTRHSTGHAIGAAARAHLDSEGDR
jgi:hypothetical protein